ncbi:MAG: SMC-Scp complex subunit ScpB [Gammaproteobacteria bacterium]
MSMIEQQLKDIIEGALFAAGRPLTIDKLLTIFTDAEKPERERVKDALNELQQDWAGRSVELKQVGSGYRFQVKQELSTWISRLSDERPARYSRALLETLALIVYRQPITRAEIEEVRGVAVSSSIVKTLLEREWVRVVGHRDVPGKPSLYGTTKQFLDYFNLKSLSELPPLAEIRSIDSIQKELNLDLSADGSGSDEAAANDAEPDRLEELEGFLSSGEGSADQVNASAKLDTSSRSVTSH